MRIIQYELPSSGPCLGIVRGDRVVNLTRRDTSITGVVAAFRTACRMGCRLGPLLEDLASGGDDQIRYAELLAAGRVRSPIKDEPEARVLVSGTGLTHTGSVRQRDGMHKTTASDAPPSDSQRIFMLGLEGGRPKAGRRGTAPEWFYKGDGRILRGPGQPLDIPAFAPDGGEEPEIAGIYLIDDRGVPRFLGLVQGNEWSDHTTEKINYLYLAPSKLRVCAIGPELVTDLPFDDIRGRCRVLRDSHAIYDSGELLTGERNMCHSLANLEDHHFKFPQHRQPGDVHVHFFGTMNLSFGQRDWKYQTGDVVEVTFAGMGEPLRNPVQRVEPDEQPISTEPA
jgi:hypothetical protein